MGQRVGGSQNRLVGQQGSDAGVTGDTVPLIVQALARPGAAGNFGTGTRAVGLAQRPEIRSSTTQRAVGGILGLPSSPSNEFPRFPLMAAAQTKGPIPGDLGQLQRMEAEGLDAARNRRIAPPATPDRLEGVIEAKDAASRAIAAILDPIAGGADAMLHMNKVLTSRDDVLPELRRRGLEREKRELERDARGLARLVQAGRLSSKEATDTYYQKARVLTVHNPAKYDPQAEENALILAAGAAFDQYIREKTLSGRPGEPTIGNWISGGALGNDTLHHFFANAYNTYLGVPTPIQRYAANAGEEDARDVNANNLGSRFGTRLRRGRVRPSEVITSPPPGRETPVDRVF